MVAQVDVTALHLHLGFAIEVAHGEVGVAHAGAHRAGVNFQRQATAGRHLKKSFALEQSGDALVILDAAGKRRVGVQQHFGAVIQLQALAFTDDGEVVGLQTHGQVAEVEQTHQQYSGGGQGFPMWFDTPPRTGLARHCQGHSGAVDRRAAPGCLGLAEGEQVRRVAGQPGIELGLLPGLRALQGDQPVESLVHGRVLQHLMSQLMGAQFIRIRHGVPRVFATF